MKTAENLDEWYSQVLRVTLFHSNDELLPQVESWWEGLMGEIPEEVTHQPKAGGFHTHGVFGDGQLELNVQPGRIDWVFSKLIDPDLPESLPVIGRYQSSGEPFKKIMLKWISRIDFNISRIAFAGVLILPVESRAEGYDVISGYLPKVEVDIQNSSDFMYQINRPRKSHVENNLVLNRLSRWSVVSTTKYIVHPDGSRGWKEVSLGELQYAGRLEFDVNSAIGEDVAFPDGEQSALLEELMCLTDEIIINGDVA